MPSAPRNAAKRSRYPDQALEQTLEWGFMGSETLDGSPRCARLKARAQRSAKDALTPQTYVKFGTVCSDARSPSHAGKRKAFDGRFAAVNHFTVGEEVTGKRGA